MWSCGELGRRSKWCIDSAALYHRVSGASHNAALQRRFVGFAGQVFGGADGADFHMRVLAKAARCQGTYPRSSNMPQRKWQRGWRDAEGLG